VTLNLSHTNCLFYFVSLCICLTQKSFHRSPVINVQKKMKKTKETNEQKK
jgi:hypothetical protein